ncbi:MAG: CDP-glycerol glycerophosphotransferase family protein [bacterium]|nr:CDP-glycerol glycerophosphotransferase family protein [bacterium]
MTKTIFITIFQGVEARNILRTDIYKELVGRPDVRLVLFTDSEEKRNYYQKEFNGPNVIYEVVGEYHARGIQKFFGAAKFNLINTATVDIKRDILFFKEHSYLKFYRRWLINRLFARNFVRRIVRWLDWRLVSDQFFKKYFDQYDPDLVLSAHLFGGTETAVIREARRRGVVSVGLINSWDKLTARAMIRLLPDWMIVHNDSVKKDAIIYADMPAGRIFVSGIPHFDRYKTGTRAPRDRFLQEIGLDPDKKTILYLPVGRAASDDDADMMKFFADLLSDKRLKFPTQLIFRFPPNDEIVAEGKFPNGVVIQTPGRRFSLKRGSDWDMNEDDFRILADTITSSDVVVGYPSTMMIDAAIFDKPVINIAYERRPHPRNFILWAYEVDHYRSVLNTGAVRLVKNDDELIDQLNAYFADPSSDREGRRRLVAEQCGAQDGKAGKRVADFLLNRI